MCFPVAFCFLTAAPPSCSQGGITVLQRTQLRVCVSAFAAHGRVIQNNIFSPINATSSRGREAALPQSPETSTGQSPNPPCLRDQGHFSDAGGMIPPQVP